MKNNCLRFIFWSFCALSGGGLLASSESVELGLQSWTCRNMTFEQVVDFAGKHGITQVQFIPNHFGIKATREEALRRKAVLDERGLTGYTFGVVQMGTNKEANRRYFDFARLMGVKMIIVEPTDLTAWDNLEELVREYDIKLAIHNHGRGTAYGEPETVKRVLAARDSRIGVCLDVGWVTAAGFDVAEVFRGYGDRVFDVHFKDKHTEIVDGKSISLDTEIGKGDANYDGLFAEMKKSRWSGVLAIETDSKAFSEDPNRLVAEAKAFFQTQMSSPTTEAQK